MMLSLCTHFKQYLASHQLLKPANSSYIQLKKNIYNAIKSYQNMVMISFIVCLPVTHA